MPIGWSEPRVAELSIAGAIIMADCPFRKLLGKAAHGWARSTRTVWSSTTVTWSMRPLIATPLSPAVDASSMLSLSAAASRGWPFWKVTPVRRTMVYESKVAFGVHDSANHGAAFRSASVVASGSRTDDPTMLPA